MAKAKHILFISLLVLSALSALAFAKLDIQPNSSPNAPIGLKRIIDFNRQSTIDFSVKVSFFIAFIAGTLGILSPCILPFLPAYVSYTFKEKRNLTWMTLIFYMGFSLVFVAMGIIAGFIGEQTLLAIQKGWLVTISGIFLIVLGIISLRGKRVCSYLSFSSINNKFKGDAPGTFLFGVFFALGWTACLGPILAGILGIGALLGNLFYSALLLLFYSFGNLVPLFVLSMVYDRFNLQNSRLIHGRIFTFHIGKKEYHIHSTNLVSGALLIFIGVILLIYKGTAIVNAWDIFGTKNYFYSIQRQLIEWRYANALGIVIFFLFAISLGLFLWKRKIRIDGKVKERKNKKIS